MKKEEDMAEDGNTKSSAMHLLALCFIVTGVLVLVVGVLCIRLQYMMLGAGGIAIGAVMLFLEKKNSNPS